MNLMFVGFFHGFGGAEKMLITLANEMANRGHEVELVSLMVNNPQYEISNKVKYIFLKDESKNSFLKIIKRYKKFKKIISQYSPDLIINFWLQPAYLCAFMGKKISSRTIYAERSDPYDKQYSGMLGMIRRIAFNRLRGFVFQSKGAQECFNQKVQSKSCVIHNPVFINPNDYPIPKIRDKKVVTVGRLHPQKNQALLIDAFGKISSNWNDYVLEIYGDGELKDVLQEKINVMGLSKKVLLMGTYKDIHERIRNASLFVLSSDYEGMPNVLLEAAAIGIPSVSTDCRPGGAREIINDNISGKIVPCGNADALANAMNNILGDLDKQYQYSTEGKKKVCEFMPKKIYDKWEHYFGSLIS